MKTTRKMRWNCLYKKITAAISFLLFFVAGSVYAQDAPSQFRIDTAGLPILGIGDLLTFLVRLIFIIAGLAALFYGLLGGIAWITSGGGKEEIQAARDKIQAAVVGIFILIIVLTILWTLETVVFKRAICFGISCNIRIPGLNITPLPPRTCEEYCIDFFTEQNYRGGICAYDIPGWTDPTDCPNTGYTEEGPDAYPNICIRGIDRGQCCCRL